MIYQTISEVGTLTFQPVPVIAEARPMVRNWIFIIDRSGSMSSLLNPLIDDLTERLRLVPQGDAVSIGWFSSEGNSFGWIVRNRRIFDNSDYEGIGRILDGYRRTVALTCFSEILLDGRQVIEEMITAQPGPVCLFFMSDGYPVVSNERRELSHIRQAIDLLSPHLVSAVLVGYGSYYNKELLSEMAERIGGALLHAGDVESYSQHCERFINLSAEATVTEPVTLQVEKPIRAFVIRNGAVMSLVISDENAVSYGGSDQDGIFILMDGKPEFALSLDHVHYLERGNNNDVSPETLKHSRYLQTGLYALSLLLSQQAKSDLALQVLGEVGDVYLIDRLNSAFTVDDFGAVEQELGAAIERPDNRFQRGMKANYLPRPDQFCILDVFETLAGDSLAGFAPQHPSFVYRRIGLADVPKEGALRLNRYPNQVQHLRKPDGDSALVWNETRMNLSIRAYYRGTVDLPEEAANYHLPRQIESGEYRAYTLVKDGVVNVKVLPMTMSRISFEYLRDRGAIAAHEPYVDSNTPVPVLLGNLPFMNRQIADATPDFETLGRMLVKTLRLGARLNVFKRILGELQPREERAAKGLALQYGQEAAAWLTSLGFKDSTFDPPTTKAEAVDHYHAPELIFKAAGFSTYPKPEEAEARIDKGSAKPVHLFVMDAYDEYKSQAASRSKDYQIAWLSEEIKTANIEQRQLRGQINYAKCAVLLAKRWWWPTQDSNVQVIDGVEITAQRRMVEVAY